MCSKVQSQLLTKPLYEQVTAPGVVHLMSLVMMLAEGRGGRGGGGVVRGLLGLN